MMSFPSGSRVRLTQPHAGLPQGSVGTVEHGTEVTTAVLFDTRPTHLVVCPNSILQSGGIATEAAVMQSPFSFRRDSGESDDPTKLFWHTPRFRKPLVGTAGNFIATTATPNTLSLLLEEAQVSLHGRTRSGTWIGSVEFPLTGQAGRLRGQIRGAVEQTRGTVSDVILCIDGLTTRIVFDGAASQQFTEDLSVDMPPETAVQTITVVLICERQPQAGDCLLVVDSIDLVRE